MSLFNPQKSLFYHMILQTGPMAKLVLFILTLMSIFSWAVIINRWLVFRKAKMQGRGFLEVFWKSADFKFIFSEARSYVQSPLSLIFQEALMELKKWVRKGPKLSEPEKNALFENVTETMRKTAYTEFLRLRQGLTFLATVGNTAPFVGLFGTVWGIMRAFHDIGLRGSASLADVAPGISEALIATAFGLGAAIPAVVGYNYFTQLLMEQRTEMESFMTDFLNRIRRRYLGEITEEKESEVV